MVLRHVATSQQRPAKSSVLRPKPGTLRGECNVCNAQPRVGVRSKEASGWLKEAVFLSLETQTKMNDACRYIGQEENAYGISGILFHYDQALWRRSLWIGPLI